MTKQRVSYCGLCFGLLLALSGLQAHADIDGDVRAGGYADAEGGMIGGGALMNLEPSHQWYFNPNVEVVFPEDADLMTFNGDFHYDFPTEGLAYWIGAGPAVRMTDPDGPADDDTDLGANLLAGLGKRRGDVRPFGQFKVLFADDTEAAVMVGVRF